MMNRLERMETIQNFLDLGYARQTLYNSVRTQIDMGMKEFLKYLLWGSGYQTLTPPQLDSRLNADPALQVIDLRTRQKFRKGHIQNALSYPFDDFVKKVVMHEHSDTRKDQPVVLVCDTGHQSRVAASILVENGFEYPISLNRGMHRYLRWQDLKRSQEKPEHRCCSMNRVFRGFIRF